MNQENIAPLIEEMEKNAENGFIKVNLNFLSENELTYITEKRLNAIENSIHCFTDPYHYVNKRLVIAEKQEDCYIIDARKTKLLNTLIWQNVERLELLNELFTK